MSFRGREAEPAIQFSIFPGKAKTGMARCKAPGLSWHAEEGGRRFGATPRQVAAFAGYAVGHFDVHFHVDNLTDRRGFVMNNPFWPQSPRLYFLTVKYKL